MLTKDICTYAPAATGPRTDWTPAVRAALADMQGASESRLLFPPGCYHFWPERACERYLFISNNDAGLKAVAFPLFDLTGLEVDGGGSQFVFHGNITPFALWNSREIRLLNFTMDWERTFHSELEIENVRITDGDKRAVVDFYIPDAYPYLIQNHRLRFVMEDGESVGVRNALEFDRDRRETAFRVHDSYSLGTTHEAEEIGPNRVRVTGQFGTIPAPGNVLAVVHTGRTCPGIAIGDSRDIEIRDVTIHHAGAMAVVAQRTENIRLERVNVTPAAHKGRVVSATADATHFVNCRGHIALTDCAFQGQMDDATNVHGIYTRISALTGPRQIEVELVHGQQAGIDIFEAGDAVEFIGKRDLSTFYQSRIAAVERLNQKYSLLTLSEDLPDGVAAGDAVGNLDWVADVTISGCTTRNNRARGFLLSTAGKVVIQNNHFHNAGAAILIAGDANYWFESGGVRDVTIRGNHFDNCHFGEWGRATIDILPEIEPENRTAPYHRNITIDANTFDAFDQRLLKAHSVDGLTITNNIVRHSDDYPAGPENIEPFDISDCRNVKIENNTFVL
jgi:hypothetical protein